MFGTDCNAGRTWFTAGTTACTVSRHGVYLDCFCPITSCVETSDPSLYVCQYRPAVFYAVAAATALLWLLGIAHLRASHRLELLLRPVSGARSLRARAAAILFGAEGAGSQSGDGSQSGEEMAAAAKATEQSSLLHRAEATPATDGGTFSTNRSA
jgi:hypothetical protein